MSKAPNFLIVGVPKAGTSSLYNYLKQHPEIYLPEQKELHYFTHQELSKNTAGPGDKLALKSIINTEAIKPIPIIHPKNKDNTTPITINHKGTRVKATAKRKVDVNSSSTIFGLSNLLQTRYGPNKTNFNTI